MRMAKDAGATLIEIGHSDRREHFGETDRTVALKVAAAIAHDLIPLICVGEPLAVRDVGGAEEFVSAQLQSALSELAPADIGQVIIAYEPVWAIGEQGIPPTAEQIAPVMALISEVVTSARRLGPCGSLRRQCQRGERRRAVSAIRTLMACSSAAPPGKHQASSKY